MIHTSCGMNWNIIGIKAFSVRLKGLMLTKLAAWLISMASVRRKDILEYKDMVSIGKGRTSDCDTQER